MSFNVSIHITPTNADLDMMLEELEPAEGFPRALCERVHREVYDDEQVRVAVRRRALLLLAKGLIENEMHALVDQAGAEVDEAVERLAQRGSADLRGYLEVIARPSDEFDWCLVDEDGVLDLKVEID
jgi:hypothetical protein